ncbi:MAG: hypothetical protein ACYTG5_14475 [Planctomycetota bacterium]|jgi:hypothetical protein
MSNSGYDPFEYGLIKPEDEEETTSVPQGDPEDMLFETEGAGGGSRLSDSPAHSSGGDSAGGSVGHQPDAEDVLFEEQPSDASSGAGLVFDSAPPPAFKEKTPVRRKERPSRLSVGNSAASAAPPPAPATAKQKAPPWLQDGSRPGRPKASPASKRDPESRLSLKVASPGVSHHRRPGKSGSKLLPLAVLLGGLAGGSYCYLVLDKMILAGLVCAMGLIGSMFCAVLLRSKPL